MSSSYHYSLGIRSLKRVQTFLQSNLGACDALSAFNFPHPQFYQVLASLAVRLPVVGEVLQVVQLAHWLTRVVVQQVMPWRVGLVPMAEIDRAKRLGLRLVRGQVLHLLAQMEFLLALVMARQVRQRVR
jgi:hypothetical protein